MAKGYWIAHVDIADADAYKRYQALNAEPFRKYGARFLVRGGASEPAEGSIRSRHVIIEFPSYRHALDCYRSPEYARAKVERADVSEADLVIVEGYEGSQPGD